MRLKPFILLPLFCGLAAAVFAGEVTNIIPLSATPAAVQKTIKTQIGDGELGDMDTETNGEEIAFDVELTAKDGQERDFTVDEDGTLLNAEIAFAEAPAPVQKTVQTLLAQGELESVSKNLDDSEITFDIELAAANGAEKDFTIAADGTLLSAVVSLSETPDAVQKTIATRSSNGKVESIDKNFGDDGITYDVDWTAKDGGEKSFTVAADGSLASVAVTLAEVPPPARRTIKNRLGNGKILSIDRSFIKKQGVFPYEIHGRKDGQPFDFSVGPKGRFFGVDD
jgi:uncharacterized membrane protein YkoI